MKTSTLTEEQALVRLGNIAGNACCPIHHVGPIAAHLVGPVAAIRPDWHPNPTPNLNHPSYVDRLIEQASCGRPIRCACRPGEPNPYVRVLAGSEGGCAYPLPSDEMTQAEVHALIASGDLEAMLHVLCPRTESLMILADHARADGGGELDPEAREAVEILARALIGRTRFDVIGGWGDGNISGRVERRHGLVSEQAEMLLSDSGIGARLAQRLIEGR